MQVRILSPREENEMHYKEILYGFEYGAAKVTRLFSDHEKGWATIQVQTPKETLQIYITKTGKVRVHSMGGKEWKPGE